MVNRSKRKMNDVNKNLRAFHLSIDELLKALAHSEDVNRTVAHPSFHADSGDIPHLTKMKMRDT